MAATSDIIGNLPVEIVQEIFMRLSSKDLGNVRKCCKRWRNRASTEYFCKTKLNFNWSNVIFDKSIMHLASKIKSLIYLDDKILIVAVEPHTIMIINISSGTIEKSLFVDVFSRAEKIGDKLYVSCRTDTDPRWRLKVWDLQSYEVIFDLQTNLTGTYWKRSIYKHLIVNITAEEYINQAALHIFDTEAGKLEYNRNDITSVHCYNDMIAIGAKDGIIEILDLNYNPVMTLNCCNNCDHYNIEMNNDYLVAFSCKFAGISTIVKGICVWNLKTKVKLYTIEQANLTWLSFSNENMLICRKGASLLLVDIQTGKTIRKINVHLYNVLSNNRFLFIESVATPYMELWCPKTQKLINSFSIEKPNNRVNGYEQFWNFYRLASKTHFAYFTISDPCSVQIMDFGP